MRSLLVSGLVSLALLGGPRIATAQLVIENVQVGFRGAGGDVSYFKAGSWTPVLVRVRAGAEGFPGGRLVMETWDSDDVRNRYPVPVPALDKNQSRLIPTLVRPGSPGAELLASVLDGKGRKVDYAGRKDYEALDFTKQVFLTLGSPLPDLGKVLRGLDTDPNRLRTRYLVHADSVSQLPRRWFGYEGIDVVVFPTGQRRFLKELVHDRDRQEALAGWVRRGGRLVIGVMENRDLVARLLHRWEPAWLPQLGGDPIKRLRVDGLVLFAGTQGKPFMPAAGDRGFLVANLRVNKQEAGPLEILAEERDLPPLQPLLMRLPAGLGSVTVLALDLDRGAFTAWEDRPEFWKKLLKKAGPSDIAFDDTNNDIATDLQKELEVFPDVRPVSFGWVAFLIFLFIVLVGPLDYLFLSKVCKRLGWTWLTFPAAVLVVCAAAFYAATSNQGRELRVNKLDLIEIDQLASRPRVQGTSWMSLFSPGIARYSVGVEAAAPDWAARPEQAAVSWLGRPEVSGLNSTGRRRAQSLFRTGYDFQPDATGLTGVPLTHASTRSFTASWESPWPRHSPRPFTARLTYSPESSDRVSGTVVNRLPVELLDPVLVYGGRVYAFAGPLLPGRPVRVAVRAGQEVVQWQSPFASRRYFEETSPEPAPIVNNVLFHERINQGRKPSERTRDNDLRRLDQSWRLRDPNRQDAAVQEAILQGRLPRVEGPLDEVARHPSSPSRLSLDGPPGSLREGPGRAGVLIQDTFVRVLLPVTPQKSSGRGTD
jgi:hypothetical protein